MHEFKAMPKIPRLSRTIAIQEKLDGTNSSVYIDRLGEGEELVFLTGSRNRWITPEADNYGFSRWAHEHKEELIEGLGHGHHFGEWWGQGIQRRYGLNEKRFSLFNTSRWNTETPPPACCHVVPLLYEGKFDTVQIDSVLEQLKTYGSVAAPGYMNPEGVIIYHVAARQYFKKTIEKDQEGKGS